MPSMSTRSISGTACAGRYPHSAQAARNSLSNRIVFKAYWLKGEQRRGEEPRQPARRVAVVKHAAPGIGDLRVGDALRGHLVVAVDIVDPHQPGEANEFVALVQAHSLFALDQQRAIGQHAMHRDGDGAAQGVLLRALGRAVEVTLGARRSLDVGIGLAEHRRNADADARFLAEAGAGALARLSGFVEHYGKNIANPYRAI